eukprot:4433226-Pleurochrysis_carterae.AAC.1
MNLRTRAPNAHCANVTRSAPAALRASRIGGYSHSGACNANAGHHARPPAFLQSAGFSTSHGTPAPCAAATRRAVTSARALCLRMYATHRAGTGTTPPGCWRVRSCEVWATENDEQGGAANTAPNRPASTQAKRAPATSSRETSWSRPRSPMSMVTACAPRAASEPASDDSAA